MSSIHSVSFKDIRKDAEFLASKTLNLFVKDAVSAHTGQVMARALQLIIPLSPSMLRAAPEIVETKRSLAHELFDARASAKQLVARIAMHIDEKRRRRLFHQIDLMHDFDEWESEDSVLELSSFASFLRSLFDISPQRLPSLGMTHDGKVLAAWQKGNDRLVIEYLPSLRARWSLSRDIEGEIERGAGVCQTSRLREVMKPYSPEHWFAA